LRRVEQLGTASATPAAESNVMEPDVMELVSVGVPYGDMEIQIVDPEHLHACAGDQVGEIWLRGGSVGRGYWQQSEASEAVFGARLCDLTKTDKNDEGSGDEEASGDGSLERQGAGEIPAGWLRTGDLGFFYQGQLFVCGRIKELIILQGQNYAPQTFETLAQEAHPDVRSGCVVAFGARESDQSPEALVILAEIRPESKAASAEIEAAIRQQIAKQTAVPVSQICLLPKATLPKTTSGKLRRLSAKELFEQGKLKPRKP
jgi:acyl-CoA synthetase (AMP-forming)/AMP-acid ligase II